MKTAKKILLGLGLIALSALFYFIHYEIFGDAEHILNYIIIDIAFIPIEVLLVTIGIHGLLSYREKQTMLKKLNMVIGTFFSEIGNQLLNYFSEFDSNSDKIRKDLIVTPQWFDQEFRITKTKLRNYDFSIDTHRGDIEELRNFLLNKREFLLTLLQNPNLLEHESFTELLWAVFHLTEETAQRQDINHLSDADSEHIANDIHRAYTLLIMEWLAYMKHLRCEYPYLFSLSVRTNPFNPHAKPELE